MAFSLKLPKKLARQWAMKIRDRERVEPPHVTVLRKTQAWRLDLRTGEYMDREPEPDDVPSAVRKFIDANWEALCEKWDEMYPENPVDSDDEEENSDD
jgi:hypothetical protein